MKSVLQLLTIWALRFLVSLRYRVEVKGVDKLDPKKMPKPGGTLFLPNHPAVFIDPLMVCLPIFRRFRPRPLITEYVYFTPGIYGLMKWINALPVPGLDLAPNSLKRARNEATFAESAKGLKKGESFLVYPSGRTKSSGLEVIGGASGVHRLIQESPDANVVLVRIDGLWGSVFSRAINGQAPLFWPTLAKSAKAALRNFIFFMPRRKVTIEYVHAPADFPWDASRRDLNAWLEDWYNAPYRHDEEDKLHGEELVQVSFSWWRKDDYPKIHDSGENDDQPVYLERVPNEVKDALYQQLSAMTKKPVDEIQPDMDLATDLGLDSLDGADLIAFLEEHFHCGRVDPVDLTTVKRVLGIASGQVKVKHPDADPHSIDLSKWSRDEVYQAQIAEGTTLQEVFLRACDKHANLSACVDGRAGLLTYKDLKLRALLLAEKIRYLPGQNIGIMLPASVASSVVILATLLAGKVPVMVNWTIGRRHLETVVELSGIEVVLTGWAFIDRLDNVDLEPIHDQIRFLEEIRHQITLRDKIQAFLRSRKDPATLMRIFGLGKVQELDPAVVLFTSGTEKAPKGVPLSHYNILQNQRAALQAAQFDSNMVVMAMLPPFHSFGFTLTGLLPIFGGVRVAYSPDPTDGGRLAREAKAWRVTMVCGAPTFLKGLLKVAKEIGVESLNSVWSGAETAPPELIALVKDLGPEVEFCEGYGVTECSPVVTIQRPNSNDAGVGHPIPGVRIKCVHPETYEELPTGQQGLILTNGPNVFAGYLRGETLPSPFYMIGEERWYVTGDLGVIDEDGCLSISGRLKRFVKVGGEMVSLTAIETALLEVATEQGWPGVEEGPTLAVCAKEDTDGRPQFHVFTRFHTTPSYLNKLLRQQGISSLVKISKVFELPEIPVSGTGKINHRLLEKEYLTDA